MRRRPRSVRGAAVRAVLAAALTAGASIGCTADGGVREPGDLVTAAEADVLSSLLLRNYQRGGADVVVTAPFGPGEVMTLTGEVDFRRSQAAGRLVTTFGNARPDATADVVVADERLWIGVDGAWVERPLADGGTTDLVDVLARVVLNLGRSRADDPAAFRDGDWTWQGRRSVDSRLGALFTGPGGERVTVDATDDLLLQYATALPDREVEVSVTLAGHGRRTVALPAEAPGS